MSYGHSDDITRQLQKAGNGAAPPWYTRPDARKALAARDVTTVYQMLYRDGVPQREIARRTGQSQSEVSEIIHGSRQVRDVEVLERIADGLGVPRPLMRLLAHAPGDDGTYGGEVTVTGALEGVSAEMLRRHVLALSGATMIGAPIKGLGELLNIGELLDLGGPAPMPPPSRLFGVHVAQVQHLTRGLREAIHAHGANPQMSSAAAAWADQLLSAHGTELVKRALMVAVAELHTVAGWAGSDAGLLGRAMYHYGRALELATKAGDAYLQAVALSGAGGTMLEHGHPDDGLKMVQLGEVKSWDIPPDHDLRTVVEACVIAASVPAWACLGDMQTAGSELGKSRQVWTPTHTDPWGDPDGVGACLELARGRLDVAEPLAATSVRRWEGISERARTLSGIVLATIHVRAGEPRGLQLAHGAITDVMKLSSVQARTRLAPLATALEARPCSDAKELARLARQVAVTRA